eukprot:5240761-Amphidinium_carterae.1
MVSAKNRLDEYGMGLFSWTHGMWKVPDVTGCCITVPFGKPSMPLSLAKVTACCLCSELRSTKSASCSPEMAATAICILQCDKAMHSLRGSRRDARLEAARDKPECHAPSKQTSLLHVTRIG